MITRIITAIVAFCVLLPFLIFSDTFMLLIFSGVLTVVAIYEMLDCTGLKKNWFVAIPSYLFGILCVLLTRFGNIPDNRYISITAIICFNYMMYMMVVTIFSKGKVQINDTMMLIVMNAYISAGFSSIIRLRDMNNGKYMYLLCFLTAWITDIFAYFIGSRFGKHKLVADVSPKKSIEGAVAGIIFCMLFLVGYGFIIGKLFNEQPKYISMLIIGFLVSMISQAGDLTASLVKRHYNIKDYGRIFPGHGGVIDRFDSVIAASTFLYIMCILSSYFELFI